MKEKNRKIAFAVVVILLAINLAYTFFGLNSNLNKALHSIKNTRDSINAAISVINASKSAISEVQAELLQLKKTAERSELQVRIINQQMQLKLEKSRTTVDSLQKEIQKNLKKLDDL